MSMSIKSATEIAGIPDWLGDIFSERQVRVEEHSSPSVTLTAYVIREFNELLNAAYLHFSANGVADKRNEQQKKRKRHM